MAEQLKLSLSHGVYYCPLPLHLSSDFIVGDVVLPVDFQYVSITAHLKCQQSTLIIFLRGPRFCCIYTVSGKKGATLFLPVTLRNANRFSKFFYRHTLQ